MAGKITISKSAPSMVKYKVSGTTLQEIWADIQAKGPKDGGKSRAGYTKAPVVAPKSYNFGGKVNEDKRKGEFTVEVWIKSGVFTLKPEIKAPKLASDKDLSPAAKKEWKRFMNALMGHENEHVTATEKEAQKFANELAGLKGKGVDSDKDAAKQAARENFDKVQGKKHTETKLQERLKKVNKALDSGGHGPVLKTSIP